MCSKTIRGCSDLVISVIVFADNPWMWQMIHWCINLRGVLLGSRESEHLFLVGRSVVVMDDPWEH